jgi:BirA family transcriptional regulator, biotin operon repressor / biotin---[acetyl-CoA-carboxylase] ligase
VVSRPWSDLQRPPLSERGLAAGLVTAGGLWREVRVVAETGSTNADLAEIARAGGPEGLVLVAESQTAGRGRLDREWVSPPRAGLTFSVLLRPGSTVPVQRWSWLPLLAGLAVQRGVGRLAEVETLLKWPNDVLLGSRRRKGGGVLVQLIDGAAVLGVGLNVSTRREELPREDSTSLALEEAACTDRDPILRAVLRRLATDYGGWRASGGDAGISGLHAEYVAACDTVGRAVRVRLPDGSCLEGVASEVDAAGRLVVRTGSTQRSVSAGEVEHVRTD